MRKIFHAFYHFYQYQIKPSQRHHRIIKTAANEISRIRLLQNNYESGYLLGVLRNIDPFVFEEILLLCFRERGFRVKRNSRHTGDGGIDGIVFNENGQKILIQAKRYKNSINPEHVIDFAAAIQRERAAGGFFIHTGRTGEKSRANKAEVIRILSGDSLIQFVLGR